MSLIINAARFANKCHKGQTRKYNWRPYIEHPMRVAGRISIQDWTNDELVSIGWLHDVVEDCGVNYKQLFDFG